MKYEASSVTEENAFEDCLKQVFEKGGDPSAEELAGIRSAIPVRPGSLNAGIQKTGPSRALLPRRREARFPFLLPAAAACFAIAFGVWALTRTTEPRSTDREGNGQETARSAANPAGPREDVEQPTSVDSAVDLEPEALPDPARHEDPLTASINTELAPIPPNLGRPGTSRWKGRKKRRDSVRGYHLSTESRILAALNWISAAQETDGRFDSVRHGGAEGQDIAVTSLAALAWLGAGYTTKVGKYKQRVKAAIAWLASQQTHDPTSMALRALTLSESFGMSRSGREDAESAVRALIARQGLDGGWTEQSVPNPRGPGKLDPTTWAIFALKSAKVAGIPGTADSFDRALGFLKKEQAAAVAGVPEKGIATAASAVAIGRLFAGNSISDEAVRELTGVVASRLPRWHAEGLGEEAIAWYHGTLLTFSSGGAAWRKWNVALRGALLAHQVTDGDEKGSWDPRDESPPFRWGRVGSTALATLSLEVYYRYFPFQRVNTKLPAAKSSTKKPAKPKAPPSDEEF